MRIGMWVATIVFGLTATSTAALAAPPVFDDGFLVVKLDNDIHSNSGLKPATVTYSPNIRMRAFGVEAGDAVKIKWKKGVKVLYSKRCPLSVRDGEGKLTRCSMRDAKLTAHGAVTAEIVFVDDSEDKELPLRTVKLEIARFWDVDRIIKNKAVHSPRFQVVGSDLLGMAYAWMRAPGTNPHGDVYFYFWASLSKDARNFPDPSWRCSRDGSKVRELDINGHKVAESIAHIKADDDQVRGKARSVVRYRWDLIWVKPQLVWGKDRNPEAPDSVSSSRYNISKNPGNYVCKFRSEGETVREFAFTIKPDGTMARHGAQGPGGLTLRPGAFFIPMKVVPNKAEQGFDAKAAKASVAFGRPWPKSADVKKLHAAFPKSYGTQAPRPPKGVK